MLYQQGGLFEFDEDLSLSGRNGRQENRLSACFSQEIRATGKYKQRGMQSPS